MGKLSRTIVQVSVLFHELIMEMALALVHFIILQHLRYMLLGIYTYLICGIPEKDMMKVKDVCTYIVIQVGCNNL